MSTEARDGKAWIASETWKVDDQIDSRNREESTPKGTDQRRKFISARHTRVSVARNQLSDKLWNSSAARETERSSGGHPHEAGPSLSR